MEERKVLVMKNKIAAGLVCVLAANLLATGPVPVVGGYASVQAAGETASPTATFVPTTTSTTTNVSLHPGLYVSFKSAVRLGEAPAGKFFKIIQKNDETRVLKIAGDKLRFSADGRRVSLPLEAADVSKTLEAGTDYYVLADEGILESVPTSEDEAAKPWAGVVSKETWTFRTTTDDTAAPKLLYKSPDSQSVGVPINGKIRLDFDEAIRYTDDSLKGLKIVKKGDPGQQVDLTADSVKIEGTGTPNITIAGLELDHFATYEVTYAADAFSDLGGRPAAALNAGDWTFRTVSQVDKAPTVSLFSPRQGYVGASVDEPLTLTFSEPVQPTGGTEKIRIYRLDTNKLFQEIPASSLKMDENNPAQLIIPHNKLSENTSYYVAAEPGSFVDLDGRPYAGTVNTSDWTFTTTGQAVALTSLSPANGATGVGPTTDLRLSFSRPVYPSTLSGTALTVTRSGGSVHESMPLDSDGISGFGTSSLQVKLTRPLEAGYAYTVSLTNGSLKDAEGNAFPSANPSRPLAWTFSTVTDGQSLRPVSLTPSDRSIDVGLDTPIRIAFNRNIALGSGRAALYKSNGSEVAARVSVNPSNARELMIVPNSKLEQGTSYYVDLSAGAVTDAASTGIQFAGLSGKDRWSFRTAEADTAAPKIQSAATHSGSSIRLAYNEPLDSTLYPLLGSYTVTVNGEKRKLSAVEVKGESVYLTLETGAAVGQDIRVSYAPDLRPLRDLSGNKAAALNEYAVKNNLDTALPKPIGGTASSRSIQLEFSNGIRWNNLRAYQQFDATADGARLGIEGIDYGAKTVTLYTSSRVPEGAVIQVSYTPGSAPLEDSNGQRISAFSGFTVQNLLDYRAPVLTSAELSGQELVLNYDEAMKPERLPLGSQFSVLADGRPIYVTNVEVDGRRVRLTLASSFIAADSVNVSYVPGTLKLTDLNGNAAGYLNLQPVGAIAGTSGIRSATANESVLQVIFTGSLVESSALSPDQFEVYADDRKLSVSAVSMTGSTVTLNLGTPVLYGQKVWVSYAPGRSPLKNTTGSQIAAFARLAVNNLTGLSDAGTGSETPFGTMSAAEFGREMTVLKAGQASASAARSHYNQDTHAYTLQPSALQAALQAASSETRTVVFDVPSTDNSALVNIPIAALNEAYKKENRLSIAVRYKNVLYDLPLKNIQALNAGQTPSAYVQVAIEPVPAASSIGFRLGLTDEGVKLLADSVEIRVTPLTSGMTATPGAPALTGHYDFKLSGSSPAASTSVVYEDLDSARPFFVPSHVGSSATGTVISGTTVGSRMLTPVAASYSYTDMNGHWAKDTVNELASKFILETGSGSTFSPGTTITRGTFAEYIAKGLGLPYDAAAANRFKDADYSRYLGGAIGAAVNAGIINGNTDGTFRAEDPITREQMAAMMVRALNYAGVDTTLNSSMASILGRFRDSGQISFTDEAAKAVDAGVIQGGANGRFNPKGNATQAEAATMLRRVLQQAGYLN